MSNFDESQVRRGQPGNAGKFRDFEHSMPEGGLTAEPSDMLDGIRATLHPNDVWQNDPDRLSRIAIGMMVEPGDEAAGALIREIGPEGALGQLATPPGVKPVTPSAVAAAIQFARRLGIDVVTPEDPAWPVQLSDLGDAAPFALWTKGYTPILNDVDNMVGVTGSRAATGYGDHVTMEISAGLADEGKTIVSGGSYGIEGMAHRAARATEVGRPVAVLAGGLDRYYPSGHQALLERVEKEGVVVSEQAPGTPPTKHRFMARQRIIAALSATTVIIEAGHRSGSLLIAEEAKRLGRNVGAVPGPVTSAASAGAHQLITNGTARLVTDAADVLALGQAGN